MTVSLLTDLCQFDTYEVKQKRVNTDGTEGPVISDNHQNADFFTNHTK